jgi:hypothetical protein
MRLTIQILVAALLATVIATWSAAPAADHASFRTGSAVNEEWTTLEVVAGVGRIEWSCSDRGSRVRFMARQGASERVSVRIGSFTVSRALLQRGYALELPFRRSQTWTIRRLSASLPPVVVIKVISKRTQGCRTPEVEVQTRSLRFWR